MERWQKCNTTTTIPMVEPHLHSPLYLPITISNCLLNPDIIITEHHLQWGQCHVIATTFVTLIFEEEEVVVAAAEDLAAEVVDNVTVSPEIFSMATEIFETIKRSTVTRLLEAVGDLHHPFIIGIRPLVALDLVALYAMGLGLGGEIHHFGMDLDPVTVDHPETLPFAMDLPHIIM